MMRPFVRSFAVLLALLVAYEVYALVAVPVLEPPLARRKVVHSTEADRQRAAQAMTKYQRLLAAYFPAGHWSLVQPPKVIKTGSGRGQIMLVWDEHTRHEDGRVDLNQCALLYFPTPPIEGGQPPRDAIVVEAERGAHFQFDGKFQPERGDIPQIRRGQLPGRITIRSAMREPGPEDDLRIETRDVELNSKLMYTSAPVRFRLGESVGGGEELEIRFLVEDPPSSGWAIAGIDSLEIRRAVRLHAMLDAKSLLPGQERAEQDNGEPTPPVEVTCSGPFHFDFVRYVASFDRDVELWQVHPNGPGDQLSCQQLDLMFAPRADADGRPPRVLVDPGDRQKRDLARLEASRIVARGHPVVVTSPSRGAEARGGRIQLELAERRVSIDGGSDVRLTYGPNVLQAPAIAYQQPPAESTTRIGTFQAAGPGKLYYVPDPAKPDQVLEATWQTSVELGRSNGQPVLVMDGRPQLALATMGRLVADQMKVYLRELQGPAASRSALQLSGQQGGSRLQAVPDRMIAVGRVQFDSAKLTGRTHELVATFRVEPPQAIANTAAQGGGPAQPGGRGTQRGERYLVKADHMRLGVALRGQRAAATDVACEGNVALRQLPGEAGGQQPLEVTGGQLHATNLDMAAHLTILGTAPGEPAGSRKATFQGRGVTVQAAGVELDQGQNRLWSNGPGSATMLLARDLQGQPTAAPYPLEITWAGGLDFDGREMRFNEQVHVEGADDWLRCQQLVARLTVPVRFGERVDQDAVDLAEIECRGQVRIDHRGRDEQGPTSHERVEIERIAINQQTGVIRGSGPGSVCSTHLASTTAALAGSAADAQPGAQLHFLRVNFERGLGGNYVLRDLGFVGRVRTVYGAVDSWEQELDIDRPESWPPGAVTLTCDELRVNEDPVAARLMPRSGGGERRLGPMELRAQSNVQIQGTSPEFGSFTARAGRATYQQAKDLFMLEGSQQSPATIWQQRQLGGQFIQHSAQRIQYWRTTGKIAEDGFGPTEFTLPAAPSTSPQDARRPSVPMR